MEESGTRFTDTSNLCNVACDYFTNIFHKQNNTLSHVLDVINPTTSPEDNDNLTVLLTLEKLRETMFPMNFDKCRWPDEFYFVFYQHFFAFVWPTNLS